jgi:hypothetical protein
VRKKVEEVREIFEDFAKEYVALLNNYAERCKEECSEIEDEEEYFECVDKLDTLARDEVGKLKEKYEARLKNLDLEVEWDAGSDGWEYFSAPGYHYYVCIDYHRVFDKSAKKVHLVGIWYLELNKPGGTEYKFEEVATDTHELVDEEETPFTAALVENLSAYPIRKLWAHQIDDLISELAAAERRGVLETGLKEVKEKAEKASWVYEYKHFLAALHETAEDFGIQL